MVQAGIRDEAAVFGRLSEALTDFLASLPPNKQADRTFLSSLLADRAFPNQPALRDQLVADLIQCSQDKAARRVNGQQPWQAREVVQPPRVVNTNSAPPASQPNTRPPPAAAATPQAPPQVETRKRMSGGAGRDADCAAAGGTTCLPCLFPCRPRYQ